MKKCLVGSRELKKAFPLEEVDLRQRFLEKADEGLAFYDKRAPPGNQITKVGR